MDRSGSCPYQTLTSSSLAASFAQDDAASHKVVCESDRPTIIFVRKSRFKSDFHEMGIIRPRVAVAMSGGPCMNASLCSDPVSCAPLNPLPSRPTSRRSGGFRRGLVARGVASRVPGLRGGGPLHAHLGLARRGRGLPRRRRLGRRLPRRRPAPRRPS